MQNLDEKLRSWFNRQEIREQYWEPNLFWYPENDLNPFGRLKVDPWELEVMFAAILGEPSEYYEALNERSKTHHDEFTAMGRADFIAVNAKRHELPLLTRIE